MLHAHTPLRRAKTVNSNQDVSLKKSHKGNLITINTAYAKSSSKAVTLCLKYLGKEWKEISHDSAYIGSCDIYWNGLSLSGKERFLRGKINRFPGMKNIVSKANLACILNRMRSLFPESFTFYPRTWIFLQEILTEIMKNCKKYINHITFIVKPDTGSEGRGIFLLQGLKHLEEMYFQIFEPVVIQEYITNPYLIDGYKFDLRLYTVVTKLDPPEAYLFRDGLARFCTVPYEKPTFKNLKQIFMHLTNYSLNKQNSNFILMDNSNNESSKRTISSVFQKLNNNGHNIDNLWNQIEELVAKTIVAMLPNLMIELNSWQTIHKINDKQLSCFQILGFDVILDANLQPYLLEVNANPSLSIEHEQETAKGPRYYIRSPVDEIIKCQLIAETLKLVQPSKSRSRQDSSSILHTTIQFSNILPKLTNSYVELRVIERCSKMYQKFLLRNEMKYMSLSSFRQFLRVCKLSRKGISIADMDLLFVNLSRNSRYGCIHKGNYRLSGGGHLLDFDGFYQILSVIADKKFGQYCTAKIDKLKCLLDLCEARLEII